MNEEVILQIWKINENINLNKLMNYIYELENWAKA